MTKPWREADKGSSAGVCSLKLNLKGCVKPPDAFSSCLCSPTLCLSLPSAGGSFSEQRFIASTKTSDGSGDPVHFVRVAWLDTTLVSINQQEKGLKRTEHHSIRRMMPTAHVGITFVLENFSCIWNERHHKSSWVGYTATWLDLRWRAALL